MKDLIFVVCFLALLGCNDESPANSTNNSDAMSPPAEVQAAWKEIERLFREMVPDESDNTMTAELVQRKNTYAILVKIKADVIPTTGGGVILNPAITRKNDAWWYTSLLMCVTCEDINQHGVFTSIEYVSQINGITVKATVPLPLGTDHENTLELYDPFDNTTHFWPDAADASHDNPSHWCFDNCSVCQENAVMYSPYADD